MAGCCASGPLGYKSWQNSSGFFSWNTISVMKIVCLRLGQEVWLNWVTSMGSLMGTSPSGSGSSSAKGTSSLFAAKATTLGGWKSQYLWSSTTMPWARTWRIRRTRCRRSEASWWSSYFCIRRRQRTPGFDGDRGTGARGKRCNSVEVIFQSTPWMIQKSEQGRGSQFPSPPSERYTTYLNYPNPIQICLMVKVEWSMNMQHLQLF